MCRFIAYLGVPIAIDKILVKTPYSLMMQSQHARESEYIVNGDGFGLGWYPELEGHKAPALFASISPAWNDQNLLNLARSTATSCFFAHIRAATAGGVSQQNCHPFVYDDLMFMHNGNIGGFEKIKRYLRRTLSDEVYDWIKGQTDSEHLCAALVEALKTEQAPYSPEVIAKAFKTVIDKIETLKDEHSEHSPTEINAVITCGKIMVAVRYSSTKEKSAPSLYVAKGQVTQEQDVYHISPGGPVESVVIASEKFDSSSPWEPISEDSWVLVDESLDVAIKPFSAF